MSFYQCAGYLAELDHILERIEEYDEAICGKTFLISGASGMIGSLIVDALLFANRKASYHCKVLALVRDMEKARRRFSGFSDRDGLFLRSADINQPLPMSCFSDMDIDYVIHAASNTHPIAYSTDPINTLLTNVLGTHHLLALAKEKNVQRFMFLSSVEIYGENRGDTDKFDESYCGYIDCNSLRADYPEGKRAGETLCQAYHHQYGVDFVIARLSRTYGPTLQRSDTKAMSQFLWNALEGKPIILKSQGKQRFSYLYASDAAAGILWLLAKGKCGESYNISGKNSDVSLRELAQVIADTTHTEVQFDLPDATEAAGFSKATTALLDTGKIEQLGFAPMVGLKDGIARTLRILREQLEM